MKYIPSTFFSELRTGRIRKHDILVVKDGATTGKVGFVDEAFPFPEAAVNEHLFIVRPDARKLLPQYAYYYLRSQQGNREIMSDFRGAAQGGIARTFASKVFIPLPSLSNQAQATDILSRAEGIVCLQRRAAEKAREIIPALFLYMFGDPATNPNGWPTKLFGAVGTVDRGKSRHRPRDAKELYGGHYPFIQTGDVAHSGGHITNFTTTYSELGLAQSKLWPRGTLCITIAANIAMTGILEFDACFPDSVVGFCAGNDVRTEYVQAWLSFLQPTLEAIAPQAAQKNINLAILRKLAIPVPPLHLQEEFANRVNNVHGILAQRDTSQRNGENLFHALLARSFAQG